MHMQVRCTGDGNVAVSGQHGRIERVQVHAWCALNECVMRKKSALLFDGGDEDANHVKLTVNDDFARKLQVRM